MTAAETVKVQYLGFDLHVSNHTVLVSGRGLCPVPCRSVSEARRFVRGYRRAERAEATA